MWLQQEAASFTIVFFSFLNILLILLCDAWRDLSPFAQYKKLEKHPWKSVTFGKVAG